MKNTAQIKTKISWSGKNVDVAEIPGIAIYNNPKILFLDKEGDLIGTAPGAVTSEARQALAGLIDDVIGGRLNTALSKADYDNCRRCLGVILDIPEIELWQVYSMLSAVLEGITEKKVMAELKRRTEHLPESELLTLPKEAQQLLPA